MFNDKKLALLAKVLEQFEHVVCVSYGLKMISGGFVIAEMTAFDKDWIYIELKAGVQNDVDNNVTTENCKLAFKDLDQREEISTIISKIQGE